MAGGNTETGRRHKEQCLDMLARNGFSLYHNLEQYDYTQNTRYVIRNYPHPDLYGRNSRTKTFIQVPDPHGTDMLPWGQSLAMIMDTRYMLPPGATTDQKWPYILCEWLSSPVPNWVLVYGGGYWDTPRGQGALEFIRQFSAVNGRPDKGRFLAVSLAGFQDLIRQLRGQ